MLNNRFPYKFSLSLVSLIILLSASNVKAQKSQVPNYVDGINQWHQLREAELKSPKGWLNLAGLFWLHNGVNTFGGAKNNDCVYENPNPSDAFFPDHLGNFIFEGDSVMWESLDKYAVKVNNQNTLTAVNLNKLRTQMLSFLFSYLRQLILT